MILPIRKLVFSRQLLQYVARCVHHVFRLIFSCSCLKTWASVHQVSIFVARLSPPLTTISTLWFLCYRLCYRNILNVFYFLHRVSVDVAQGISMFHFLFPRVLMLQSTSATFTGEFYPIRFSQDRPSSTATRSLCQLQRQARSSLRWIAHR